MTDQTISDKLRERITHIENSIPVFSYNDLKSLAYIGEESGMLNISLDALKSFIQNKLK